MRKYVLMIVAMVLMALPMKANNLVDRLCEDETFVSFVTETVQMVERLKPMNAEQRKAYKATEEFACINQQLESQLSQLSETYKLGEIANLKNVMVASARKVISQRVQQDHGDCWIIAMELFSICDRLYGGNVSAWGECVGIVWAWLDGCMGLPQA